MADLPAQTSSATPISLNVFQILMRRWRELYPYNAGQVMTLAGAPDFLRWVSSVQKVVESTGLGTPNFADGDTHVGFKKSAQIEVTSAQGDLEAHVSAEVNRPFGPNDIPVRFFIIPADGRYHVGVTYDHWVADSRAIRNLMQRIYLTYSQQPGLPDLKLPDQDFAALFGHHKQLRRPLAKFWASVKNYIRHRKAYRIHLNDALNFKSQTRIIHLPDGLIREVHSYAKRNKASVNDAFLAALASCMGTYTAQDRTRKHKRKLFHGQRDRIALGTIADIRDLASRPLDQVFGLYLSSYTTILKAPEERSREELLAQIASSTHRMKEKQGTIASFLGLMTTLFWWDFYPHAKDKAGLFQKNVPVAAGISNVNMTKSWVDMPTAPEKGPQVLDYLRISPTGPLIPIVMTLTTINQRLSLCVTYRTTAFTNGQAQKIIDTFTERLKNFT